MSVINLQLNRDVFYAQRDSRAEIHYPLSQLASRHIAIAVPPETVSSALGLELALFWTTSIIRRMGRAFTELIVVTSDTFRSSNSQIGKALGCTVEQFITAELQGADPFAPFHWRSWTKNIDLSDAETVIWLGSPPLTVQENKTFVINASGWVSVVHEAPTAHLSLSPTNFDAAPAAIVFAACMAAGRVFSEAFQQYSGPRELAVALDSGYVTSDSSVYRKWMLEGESAPGAAPWKPQSGAAPHLERLLVVSAGGVGGNFCQILSDSFLHIDSALIVEPDKFDISNLNRAIGVGLNLALGGASKASFAADALRNCVVNVTPIQSPYESWVTAEMAEKFRQPETAVAIGVDQVRSRLMVGSDWPAVLINGATAGVTFSTSVHVAEKGGCIGCWYGKNDASYAATRTPMACGAGVAAGVGQVRPLASYPFVSVATAAHMVSLLATAIFKKEQPEQYAGNIFSMSFASPQSAEVRRVKVNDRCLLLCGEPYLRTALGRSTEGTS